MEADRICVCSACRTRNSAGVLVPARTYRRHNPPIPSSTSRTPVAPSSTRQPSLSVATVGRDAATTHQSSSSSQEVSSPQVFGPARRSASQPPPRVQLSPEAEIQLATRDVRRNCIVHDDPNTSPENDDIQDPDSVIPAYQQSRDFVNGIASATLGNGDIAGADLYDLLNPPREVDPLDDDKRLAVELFAATSTASEAVFEAARQAILRRFPDEVTVPSHDATARLVQRLSGVVPVRHDMCPNSCIAYTGPFSAYTECPECRTSRYDPIRLAATDGAVEVPQQSFYTMPLGPQLQALYRHPDTAAAMAYRAEKTQQLRQMTDGNGVIDVDTYDDIFCGQAYLEAHGIEADDTVLMFSIDGAQLYRNKQSDTWIGIWVILNLAPGIRYMKHIVLPSFVIPGPNKPRVIESFLYPTLHHLAAIQKHGLPVWNGQKRRMTIDRPFVHLVTADGPAMQDLNGNNGHLATRGCRRFCDLKGRHKPGASQYFPVLSPPTDYPLCPRHGLDCNAHVYDIAYLPVFQQHEYEQRLRWLGESRSAPEFAKRRQETGINKASIFSGLPRILAVPQCCPGDLMHHAALNLPDLLVGLWRATLECDTKWGDSVNTWAWAVLKDSNLWKAHGKTVADATPYLPGFFDRPPRNPAEKINSGYKAVEYLTWIYVLGPGLLRRILPTIYYRHFCLLVSAMRILHQRSIARADLILAHQQLLAFVRDFEVLYYGRFTARIHFVRQSVHSLTHLAHEVRLFGPPGLYSQWTMERTIGNLGQEIRQPSNPYMNLSQRAVRRGQLNAIMALIPSLAPAASGGAVRAGYTLGDGYSYRPAREDGMTMPILHVEALRRYLVHTNRTESARRLANAVRITRWARLALPCGHIARCAWKEDHKAHGPGKRIARNVKVRSSGSIYYVAEVLYYFLHHITADKALPLAIVHKYTVPDSRLREESHNTLNVCTLDRHTVHAIRATDIVSVVGMVPVPEFSTPSPNATVPVPSLPQPDAATSFFIVEKLGLDIMQLGGSDVQENED